MRTLWCVAVTSFVFCAGSGQLAGALEFVDSGKARVQIRTVSGGLLVVPVAIEGRVYPFLLDTGSASTLIDTTLAAELHLTPRNRVVLVTAGGTAEASGSVSSLTFGAVEARNVEVVLLTLDAIRALDPAIRGVLGQDVLGRTNWLLDYRRGVIVQDVDGSLGGLVRGHRLAIRWAEGRPSVDVLFGRTRTDLVLDSAATGIMLFERPALEARGGTMRLRSLDVEQEVSTVVADCLRIGPFEIARPTAGVLPRDEGDGAGGGLLPTAMFDSVYFDYAGSIAVVSVASGRAGASRLCGS